MFDSYPNLKKKKKTQFTVTGKTSVETKREKKSKINKNHNKTATETIKTQKKITKKNFFLLFYLLHAC